MLGHIGLELQSVQGRLCCQRSLGKSCKITAFLHAITLYPAILSLLIISSESFTTVRLLEMMDYIACYHLRMGVTLLIFSNLPP